MMKPRNFPERKRLRQLRALERLERATFLRKPGVTRREWLDRVGYERDVLLRAEVAGSQRDVRTKNYRGTAEQW